jgi:hypothetical protein
MDESQLTTIDWMSKFPEKNVHQPLRPRQDYVFPKCHAKMSRKSLSTFKDISKKKICQ